MSLLYIDYIDDYMNIFRKFNVSETISSVVCLAEMSVNYAIKEKLVLYID